MKRSSHSHLRWSLGPQESAADYGVFRTAFVEGTHPQVAKRKRFSLIDCTDWVNVLALTPEREVVLIRQFRPGSGEVCLEIPGGMVDPGEAPAAAAERELFEETGFRARSWRALGAVSPNPALFRNRLHIYLAENAWSSGPAEPEGSEVIDVELWPLTAAWRALANGEIDHALVVAAFAHLAAIDLAK